LSKQSYLEALDWLDSSRRNKIGLENFKINLAFAYCYSKGLHPHNKEQAKSFLLQKYSLDGKKDKEVMKKIGEQIFR